MNNNNNNTEIFVPITEDILHVHTRDSGFDSTSKVEDLLKRANELGCKAMAFSDHGVVSSFLDAVYHSFKYNIKIIYSIEAYLEVVVGVLTKREHIILMAKNKKGINVINKAVTDSFKNLKNGFPCLTMEMLEKHFSKKSENHGNVIATSACLQGGANTILLSNKILEKEILKLENSLNKKGNADEILKKYDSFLEKEKELVLQMDSIEKSLLEKKSFSGKKPPELKASILELESARTAIKKEMSTLSKEIKELGPVSTSIKNQQEKIADLKRSLESEESLEEKASERLLKMREIFGEENFYAEVQYHFIKDEAYAFPILSKIAKRNKIPLVAANDAHMVNGTPEEVEARKLSQFLRYGTIFSDNNRDMFVEGKTSEDSAASLYLKSQSEIYDAISQILPHEDCVEALNNVKKITDCCEFYEKEDAENYPVFSKELDFNAEEKIRELCEKGIKERFPNPADFTQEYKDRLEYELSVMTKMNVNNYHLIVKESLDVGRILGEVPDEMLEYAPLDSYESLSNWFSLQKEKNENFGIGIGIGEGRGSAAGSLVCYVLNISGIDPIKYDLLFERYLNPDRVSMPDIDSDFSPKIREMVMTFLINKYGESAVCRILTKSISGVKGGIRDAARYLDAKNDSVEKKTYVSIADKIRKQVDTEIKESKNAKEAFSKIKTLFSSDLKALEIINLADSFEGSVVSTGIHAAGLIIGKSEDITDVIPLKYNTIKKCWSTQCNMTQAEELGLLKIDILGLKTLSILTEALRSIYKNTGLKINIRDCVNENSKTIKKIVKDIYTSGKTVGIFQFESKGIKSALKDIGPENLSDLILINALYRPGPLEFIPVVAGVKNGKSAAFYKTPKLKPILEHTYGVFVYQEQIMETFKVLAKYSLSRADNVRRFMSKKKEAELEKERDFFVYGSEELGILGCVKNGISADIANSIFDDMTSFAKYAFNKSHAAIYAITSFYTAWMKYMYPVEFYCSVLNHCDKVEKIGTVIRDLKTYNINGKTLDIRTPSINKALEDFSNESNEIFYGIKHIKSFDKNATLEILRERNNGLFAGFVDFVKRVSLSEKKIDLLINAGAFDEFGHTRSALKTLLSFIFPHFEKIKKKNLFIEEGKQVLELLKERKISTIEDFELLNIAFSEFKFTSKNKKSIISVPSVEKRIFSAMQAVKEAEAFVEDITIPFVLDNEEECLEKERELLGFYVSKHPYELYFNNKSTKALCEIDSKTDEVCGIITDLRTNDKGSMMFKIEDLSDSVDCAIYWHRVCEFENVLPKIKNGQAVKINKKVSVRYIERVVDESESSDVENDDYVETIKEEVYFFALDKEKELSFVEKNKQSFLIEVEDVFEYMDLLPELQRHKSLDEKGFDFHIFDSFNGEKRIGAFKLNSSILNSKIKEKIILVN